MSQQVLAQLSDAGVALWLDDISRDRLSTGNFEALIRLMVDADVELLTGS